MEYNYDFENFSKNEIRSLEALKLVSDWAKWISTIETAVIAFIGSYFTSDKLEISGSQKLWGQLSVVCLIISIIAAAMLLWTLPEIAQNLNPNTNIWKTYDTGAKKLFRLNTEDFSVIVTLFFILGLICLTLLIFSVIGSKSGI